MKGLVLTAVGIFIIGVWIAPAKPRPRYPEKRIAESESTPNGNKTAVPQQDKESPESKAIEKLIREMQIQEQQNSEERQAQENRANQDIGIQGKLIKYTRALVYVGVAQAIVLLLTVGIIGLQIATMRNIERAWVIVSPVDHAPKIGYTLDPADPKDEDLGRDTNNIFAASFKNTGKTPARLISSKVIYQQVKRLEDIPIEPSYGERKSFSELLLVMGDSVGEVAYLQPCPLVSKAEAIAVRKRETFWYAYGIVSYRDAFNKLHETRFGYLYHFSIGGDPRPDGFIRDGLPRSYNKAT